MYMKFTAITKSFFFNSQSDKYKTKLHLGLTKPPNKKKKLLSIKRIVLQNLSRVLMVGSTR